MNENGSKLTYTQGLEKWSHWTDRSFFQIIIINQQGSC